MTEWRTIPSFPMYEASSEGQIRRLYSSSSNWSGRSLSIQKRRSGYVHARLWVDGRGVSQWAHRLVCEAFHGRAPEPAMHAAHDNGIRDDNRPENLTWKTVIENRADQRRHGTEIVGDKHKNSKLTKEQVAEIRSLVGKITQRELGARYGIHEQSVGRIVRGVRYRDPIEQAR